MIDQPSPNGSNGRDSSGRFTKGNAGGPGNPLGGQIARLRAALIAAVSEDDMRAVVSKLVEKAQACDTAAAKLLLERYLGRPIEHDIIERLEAMESVLGTSACRGPLRTPR